MPDMAGCRVIPDREKRINCMFEVLYEITQEQDVINIGIIKEINDDTDPRWKAVHMIDNANAIILGTSRNKGNPKSIVSEGYVGEKVESLNWRWRDIKMIAGTRHG